MPGATVWAIETLPVAALRLKPAGHVPITPTRAVLELPAKRHPLTLQAEQRLSVSDTGPGVAPEEQSKIFQKFYQILLCSRTIGLQR